MKPAQQTIATAALLWLAACTDDMAGMPMGDTSLVTSGNVPGLSTGVSGSVGGPTTGANASTTNTPATTTTGGATTTTAASSTTGGVSTTGTSAGVTGGLTAGLDGGSPEAGGADASDPMDATEAGPYRPCPGVDEPCKVLPLGDSITFGLGVSGGGGYRVELFRKALGDGKDITFVGSESNGPQTVDGVAFPGAHEGHSGWTISQIAGLVPTPALSDDPHIVLLMIGTNDMVRGDPATAPDRLDALIGDIVTAVPEALLVVAQLTPMSFSDSAVQQYNAALPAIIQAHEDAGEHVLLVDMHTGFDTDMLADGVHPNAAGYAHMAQVWYDAIAELFP